MTLTHLEDRSNPTTGVPWLDSTSLSLSFAPDGTDVSGQPSSLSALLAGTPTATWQKEVLRAFQTWAVQANINIGLTADSGLPFGTPGAPQEDSRFGDIRIGARPLSNTLADSLAGSTGFSHAGGTWSGDVLLNTRFNFGVGATAGQNDLFTVAVQEAGNALSLFDNQTDKTSVMYPYYQGRAVTGLGAADVAAIQALYGARKADAYEGAAGNGTAAAAYNLTANGNLTAVTADVTQPGDVDYYTFTAPTVLSMVTRASVDLKASGLSLFTGKVTVYNSAGGVVGSATAADPRANDLSVPITGYVPGATYTVRVEGAGGDVFSVGAYNLVINYDRPIGLSKLVSFVPYVNYEGWSNNGVLATAQGLAPITTANLSTFAVGGLLTSANDVDWFKFTAPASGTLTASVWAFGGSTVLPAVKVYDAAGAELPTTVVANGGGLFTVQAAGRAAGTYYARVAAADPTGTRATGLYVLGTNLGVHPPTLYDDLSAGTLTAGQAVAYSTLTVRESRLTQFALSVAGTGDSAVRMSVYDAQGNRVFTLVAFNGQPLATGAVWLGSGTYTVVYNAATRTGVPLPSVAYTVRKWERSSPIDPYPEDPTSPPPPPPPGGQVAVSPPTTSPPPYTPPLGPISDPYQNV